jgi:hypothetical protein
MIDFEINIKSINNDKFIAAKTLSILISSSSFVFNLQAGTL